MSNENVGAIRTYGSVNGPILYERKHRGITLPYDNMTKKERDNLNGPIKTYYIEVDDDA